MKIKLSLLFFGTVLALILSLISRVYIGMQFETKRDTLLSERTNSVAMQNEVLRRGYMKFSTFIFDESMNKPEITLLMKKAKDASQKKRDFLRGELFAKLSKTYTRMKKEHIRQLHFHLPNAISFLRFHRPSKYGDDLSAIRESIVQVNKTHKMVSGFEEGRIFNGIRHVFPLFHEEEFVGTVEISYSFFAYMFSSLQKEGELFYHAILKTDVHNEKVWKSEHTNYPVSKLHSDYVYDKKVYSKSLKKTGFDLEREGDFLSQLSHSVKKDMDASISSAQSLFYDDASYSVVLQPIENIQNDKVAYFISIKKDRQLASLEKSLNEVLIFTYIGAVMISILLTLLIANIYYRFFGLDKWQRKITSRISITEHSCIKKWKNS
jgi:hypothetical protein